jgi:hypothetical protein
MEPEQHIQQFGIDHYLITIFPNDTEERRKHRRKHLLSYECIKIRQDFYEKNKFIYFFK